MKLFFNLLLIAYNEFIVNLKIFVINILICSLLFGVMLSMTGLALNIPKEIESEILNSEVGTIQLSNLNYNDVNYIVTLPIQVYAIGYDMDWTMFSEKLNREQKKVNEDWNVDNSLNFAYYVDGVACVANEINQQMLLGELWTENDNQVKDVNALWLDKQFAEIMHLQVGDVVTLANINCSLNFCVKGIYEDLDDSLAASYVSFELYGDLLCEEGRNAIVYARAASSPFEFLKVIQELKNKYYIVEAYDENIYAMFLLVLFVSVCTALLFAITLNVVIDFSNIYFASRQKFWAVNKALGLEDNGRKIVCCILCLTVITISYGVGMVISVALSNYFTQYINTLFEFEHLKLGMTMEEIVIVFLGVVLLGNIISWNKKITISIDIKG